LSNVCNKGHSLAEWSPSKMLHPNVEDWAWALPPTLDYDGKGLPRINTLAYY